MTKYVVICCAILVLLLLAAQRQNVDLTPFNRTVNAPVVSYTFEIDSSKADKQVIITSFKALRWPNVKTLSDTLTQEDFFNVLVIPSGSRPQIKFTVYEDSTYDMREVTFFIPWPVYDSLLAGRDIHIHTFPHDYTFNGVANCERCGEAMCGELTKDKGTGCTLSKNHPGSHKNEWDPEKVSWE
ncbi:MAG: hypothetical protein WCV85_02590 [Patescibacteria group bacterium]